MTRRAATITGGALVVATLVLGVLVMAVQAGVAGPFDLAWNGAMAQLRESVLLPFALVMNRLGGGWIATLLIPLLIAAVLVALRRWRAAMFALAAFAGSALLVQVLKGAFGRARPEDMMVAADFGSFPSGHVANAATIAVVLWLVFPRVWIGVAGIVWTLLMALSRTVLSVHWLTDTVGGALIGASVALLVSVAFWPWVRPAERESRGVVDG